MKEVFDVLRRFFSLDMVIYAAILMVTLIGIFRCVLPLGGVARKLRRASRVIVTEHKQKKDKKSWHDVSFLGDRLQAIWSDFLQNAEMRSAHGESCDVTQYINEDAIVEAVSSTGLAESTPGLLTSLGILGTFLGLVTGLSGLTLSAAHTEQLLAAMEQLIGGMSTAFLTSIAGVSASLLFTLLNNSKTTACAKAVDRFCEVFSLYAMPKPVSGQTEMLTLQQEQTAVLRRVSQEIGERLSAQMEDAILRAMLPVQRSMDNFILAATHAQVEGVDRIVGVFVKRMNVALGQEFDHLRQVLQATGQEQANVQREMRDAASAIDSMTRDVINMQQMTQGTLEHFKGYVTDMTRSRSEADELQARTSAMLGEVTRNTAMQGRMLTDLMDRQSKLDQSEQEYLARLDRYLAASQQEIASSSESLNQVCERLRDAAAQLSRSGSQFTRQTAEDLERQMQSMSDSLTRSSRQLAQSLQGVQKVSEQLPDLVNAGREQLASEIRKMNAELSRFTAALAERKADGGSDV